VLRVRRRDAEVHDHAGSLADHPGVVARLDPDRVVGAYLGLGAVVHPDRHPPGEHVQQVRRLAGLGSRDRAEVLLPVPARVEGALDDGSPAQCHHEPLALVDEGALVLR